MVSICILGAGFMAAEHCRAYDRVPDATVTAVVSPSSAPDFVAEHGLDADAYAALDAALADAAVDVDALDVCTPTPTHRDYVERAVDAGLPVLCEKPLARTLADAEALRDAAETADAPVMVGHVVRFFPQYATAREQVADGRIGAPGVARARRLSPFPDWADWYAERDASGGLFLDLAVHDLDYLRWAFGDVERVFARRTRGDDFAHGTVTLAFESGARGYVEASWGQPDSRDLTYEFELAGDDGVLAYDADDDAPVRCFTADGATTESPLAEAGGYARQLAHFVDCVRSGDDPLVGPDEAVEAMRLALAAEESAERGEPVRVAEVTA